MKKQTSTGRTDDTLFTIEQIYNPAERRKVWGVYSESRKTKEVPYEEAS